MPTLKTREWDPEKGWIEVDASFRGYGSPEESTRDWLALMQSKRYAPVRAAQSVGDAARAVSAAGYATDPAYANKLTGITPKTPEQQAFFQQRMEEAKAAGANPVLAELAARQAALETGWGRSTPGGNLYGIKGPDDQRTGATMDYTQIPDTTIPGPFSGGQMPPLGPQPLGGAPTPTPMAPQPPMAPQGPQEAPPGFMDNLMGNPLFHVGLGILSQPGYGGNWMRAAAAGAQQGMAAHQQRQKFEMEMEEQKKKVQMRDSLRKQAESLPEPFRSLVMADPTSYGNVLTQMMQMRKQMTPSGKDRYMEVNGRIFDTATQQYVQPGGGQGEGAAQWSEALKPEKKVEVSGQLRDDYRTEMKAYNEAQSFYERGKAASQGGPEVMTGADDIALVFSFMKLLDPTSVVRETEYATASNAAGVPSHIQALWNNLVGGGKLDVEGRKQLLDQMERQYEITRQNQEAARGHYAQIAKELGIPTHWIFRDTTERQYKERTTTGAGGKNPAPVGPPPPLSPATQSAESELEELLR